MIRFLTVQTYMLEVARRQITPGVVKLFANWPACRVRLVSIGACGSICGRGLACFVTHFLTILHLGLDRAFAKHVVHSDASIVAHGLFGSVAACLLNLASYCNQGVSSYSLLAFIIMEL